MIPEIYLTHKYFLLSIVLFFFPQYIDEALPAESPYLYGLHPNAEIGFLTQTSEKLFRTVLEMQPRDGGSGEGSGTSRDEKVHIRQRVSLRFPAKHQKTKLFLLQDGKTYTDQVACDVFFFSSSVRTFPPHIYAECNLYPLLAISHNIASSVYFMASIYPHYYHQLIK